jgi:hypothetical protein
VDLHIKPNLPTINYISILNEFDKLAIKNNKGEKG